MTTSHKHASDRHSPCRCHDATPPPTQCCQIVCFERPNYFCGHLLTDGDLSLEQRYVIEKNKLYHRALDGYGVACGLKLTCDSQCAGHILIHDGFAIDDCGNDLIVCEPARFDVIGALRRKKLLVTDAEDDDCEPYREKPDCEVDQCFYVTICYDEQEGQYETPFQTACTSGPKECLPTRTKERVRFDVTDKLPRHRSYLSDLERRLKYCFEIYCDGPIGRLIKDNLDLLQAVVGSSSKASEGDTEQIDYQRQEGGTDPCDLFCALRAHFLHHLRQKPDEFNCMLFDAVTRLRCPDEYDEDDEAQSGEIADAFRELLIYMQQYQFDCAFGELLVPCPEPCEAHCLVLGTIEIRGGKLQRVCNVPRRYLWSPANFVPVLVNSILTGGHCDHKPAHSGWQKGDEQGEYGRDDDDSHEDEHDQHHRHRGHECCCPTYPKFLPEDLLAEFEYSECGRYFAATSAMKAFEEVLDAVRESFDFTDSRAISAEVLTKAAARIFQARKGPGATTDVLGIKVSLSSEQASALNTLNPLQALLARGLAREHHSAIAYRDDQAIRRVLPDYLAEISPEPEDKINQYESRIRELTERVDALTQRVAELDPKRPSDQDKKKRPKTGGADPARGSDDE
jgi:hypothetical protein